MIQLTLNVKVSNTTKVTPFFANFEKESNLFKRSKNQISIKTTIKKENTIKTIQDNIFKMQTSSTTYQNKKRKTTLLLKKKNKIYFFTKNLKINKKKKQKTRSCQSRVVFYQNCQRSNQLWIKFFWRRQNISRISYIYVETNTFEHVNINNLSLSITRESRIWG